MSPDGDFDDEDSVYFPVDYSSYLDFPVNIRNHHLRWREFEDYWNVENY